MDEIKRKAGEGYPKPAELMGAGERGLGMHKIGISGGEKAGTPEMKSV